MGALTDAKIRAWQEACGIEPATGMRAKILERMSEAAYGLIKVIELERSGIRDGDGYWHGSGVMDHATDDLVELIEAYRRQVCGELDHLPSALVADVSPIPF
jgi:hypothetical protein